MTTQVNVSGGVQRVINVTDPDAGTVEVITVYIPGQTGARGAEGPSAYDVAVANGFVGTEAEWLASLKGADGVGGGGGGAVDSVNGEVGAVVLDAADVGARPDTYVPAWDEVTGKPAIPDSVDDIGAETPAGAQAKVDTHAADTTAVHGIADTSALATTADVSAASTADRARVNHTGTQTSATISDFTEAVQDAVAALLTSGSNVTLTYDDAANSLTVTAASGGDAEVMRDTIGAALVGVGNVAVTVNDAADTITISTTATVNSTDAALRDRSTHTGTQTMATISDAGTAATKNTGTGATNVILGNDARLTDARTPTAHTHTASAVTFTPTGTIAATDVQAAIAEVAAEAGSGSSSGGIIAYKKYASGTSYATTSTTAVDIDATNLVVTFTAPASGAVLVRLSSLAQATDINGYTWHLRESTTIVAQSDAVNDGNGARRNYVSMPLVVTGLTPGSSHTYKWAHSRAVATGSGSTWAAAGIPAVMEVLALP